MKEDRFVIYTVLSDNSYHSREHWLLCYSTWRINRKIRIVLKGTGDYFTL